MTRVSIADLETACIRLSRDSGDRLSDERCARVIDWLDREIATRKRAAKIREWMRETGACRDRVVQVLDAIDAHAPPAAWPN